MCRLSLLSIFFILLTSPVNAEEPDGYCTRRAVEAVAELRRDHYPKISAREIEIARKTAAIVCINTRLVEKSTTTRDDQKISQTENTQQPAKKNKSWIEKLLDNEKKEDVSPMMKAHRTGGK